ncbi:MAG: hypothetical protein IT582_02740 [Opitutaceae bacterium]|nr:hypothetical protein [Opitutaceae bacterium]
MPTTDSRPYEMHAAGGGGFTTFETADAVALPLMLLAKATLREGAGQRLVLEYGSTCAVVEGEGLAELFAHLLAGHVKVIRCGRHAFCAVRLIQIFDTQASA